MAGAIDTAIALNRFGLGARPNEAARVSPAPQQWLRDQVNRIEAFELRDTALLSGADAAKLLFEYRQERRDAKSAQVAPNPNASLPADAEMQLRDLRQVLIREIGARSNRAIATDTGFSERLVYFWSNHFTVAAQKLATIPMAGVFEREVIRTGMTGGFFELLLASCRHPGMLLYLDQAQSVGPNSIVGQRRDRGLNENLAREILELHTLGPQGGYSQSDVTEFARALTGWTIASPQTARLTGSAQMGRFVFVEAVHEPGERTILGKRYGARGEDQAKAILADLAAHPATARTVATKLCRHFIADDPPKAAVARVEKAFVDSRGMLPALHASLVESPEAWSAERRKLKSPHDFIISGLRFVGLPSVEPRAIVAAFELLAQPTYRAPSPKGWPDTSDAWGGPDEVMKRLEWSQALAERVGGRIRPEDRLVEALGGTVSTKTLESVRRAASAEQGLALALMSPEFQRR